MHRKRIFPIDGDNRRRVGLLPLWIHLEQRQMELITFLLFSLDLILKHCLLAECRNGGLRLLIKLIQEAGL